MKANNKCIFLFGYGRFDQRFETVSFILAKELAKNNRVFYIDYPLTTKDAFRLKNTESYKIRQKAFKGENNGIIDTTIPNLKIIVLPPLWSIHFLPEGKLYRKLLQLNEKVIARTINKIVKAEGIDDFIFFNSWIALLVCVGSSVLLGLLRWTSMNEMLRFVLNFRRSSREPG